MDLNTKHFTDLKQSVYGHLPKNDVISFSRKRFCASGLGLELGLRLRLGLELAEIRLKTISVKRPIGQVY